MKQTNDPVVLNVGCGGAPPDRMPALFRPWREIRVDINPAVAPDIVGSMADMPAVANASVDAVWSSHNLEHLESHEVPVALAEWRRVLRPGGVAFITLPDLEQVARLVVEGHLHDTLYQSPAGPVSPIDMLYGHRPAIARGNRFMAHRTGFTQESLGNTLMHAGFAEVDVWSERYDLWALAYMDMEAIDRYRSQLVPMRAGSPA